MPQSKYIIILTLIVLVVIGGGYLYWNSITKYSQIEPKGPRIIEAWLNPVIPVWEPATSDYRTNLNVRYDATSAPLLLSVKISFKNQNGEGTYQDTVDISEWANSGSVYRVRTFKYPGEYAFTVTLKNNQGETSLELPAFVIK